MSLLGELVGESPEIVAIRERITRLVARASDVRRLPPVLVQGETGSGKGLVARALHRAGPRAGGPFVDVNCAAIPETLLEAEMFGFERGAFTDARQAKRGLFQAAHRGTLFLDEIGLLPEGLQTKLLTVLEERVVRRLGATQGEPVDVWVIAATNLDLQAATRAGRFREDLYHRLAVLTLTLPPLRDRRADILLLAEHFLGRACADYGLPPKTLAPDARAALVAHRWPGNIRELINVMERVALLAEGPVVTASALGLPDPGPAAAAAAGPPPAAPPVTLAAAVDSAERAHLREALEATGWNISRAAARLGISRNTIRYRLEKHGLRPDAPAPPRRSRRRGGPAAGQSSPAAAAPAIPGAVESPPPAAIRWERRRLAVLQVLLAADRAAGPLDTGRIIETLVDKVRSFGGRVEELAATGFVALFGLDPVEDAVRRAALAAVAMQRAAQRTPGGGPAGLRIGIDLGAFLLGRLPDVSLVDAEDKRAALDALGALVAAAEPGSIVVSAPVAPFLARGFDLAPTGGGPGRRPAFRLGGLERAEVAGSRLTRFVGRSQELDLLRSRLAAATGGQGQVVAIAGEAGIGKSRLVVELRRGLGGSPGLWLEGHCLPYATPIPCLPLVEILRGACGIVETDGPEGVRARLRATLDRAGMDALEAAPYLLHLLDPGESGAALAGLRPEVVKARTFEALRELSRRLAGRAPLVLVVEDLHWIDRTSEEYLATLVDVVAGARILLVTTHRPGYRPPWMDRSSATQIALQPLSRGESLSVVEDVLGGTPVDAPTVELIVAKAEGNPFFAEELARAVTEGGHPAPGTVPDTVEEVLLARIDRLGVEDKRVLQAAAVIGRRLSFLLLQTALDPPDDALRERLARLQAAEFLYETRAAAEPEYAFKHPLTHEVAYASLLPAQRRALHARIVDVLEGWQLEGREELVERLAHHAIGAERWDKAVAHARRAGRQALARSAHQEAAAWFEQALAALARLPERPELQEQAVDVRFELRNALFPLGRIEQDLEQLRAAEPLARRLADQRRLAWISAYMARDFTLLGDQERALELGQRALDLANGLGEADLQVLTQAYLGSAHHALGHYRLGAELLRRSLAALDAEGGAHRHLGLPGPASVFCRSWLVWSLAKLGDFAEGAERGRESVEIAQSAEQPLALTVAQYSLGFLHLHRGDLAQAVPLLERSLALCRAWNLAAWFPNVASSLGHAYALTGAVAGGLELLEQAVARAGALRIVVNHAGEMVWLGEALLLAGRDAAAVATARRALELARRHGERGNEAHALRLHGDLAGRLPAAGLGDPESHYAEALRLARAHGMRPLEAHCHLGLGRLHRRAGRADAVEHLGRAQELYRSMDMRRWRDLTEAELPVR